MSKSECLNKLVVPTSFDPKVYIEKREPSDTSDPPEAIGREKQQVDVKKLDELEVLDIVGLPLDPIIKICKRGREVCSASALCLNWSGNNLIISDTIQEAQTLYDGQHYHKVVDLALKFLNDDSTTLTACVLRFLLSLALLELKEYDEARKHFIMCKDLIVSLCMSKSVDMSILGVKGDVDLSSTGIMLGDIALVTRYLADIEFETGSYEKAEELYLKAAQDHQSHGILADIFLVPSPTYSSMIVRVVEDYATKRIEGGEDSRSARKVVIDLVQSVDKISEALCQFRQVILSPDKCNRFSRKILLLDTEFIEVINSPCHLRSILDLVLFGSSCSSLNFSNFYRNLGNLMLLCNKCEEAVVFYTKVCAWTQHPSLVHDLLGCAYFELAEEERRMEVHRRCSSETREELGSVKVILGRGTVHKRPPMFTSRAFALYHQAFHYLSEKLTGGPVCVLSVCEGILSGLVFLNSNGKVKIDMFLSEIGTGAFGPNSSRNLIQSNFKEVCKEDCCGDMYRKVSSYRECVSGLNQRCFNLIAEPLLRILRRNGAGNSQKVVIVPDECTARLSLSGFFSTDTESFLCDSIAIQHSSSQCIMTLLTETCVDIVLPLQNHRPFIGTPSIVSTKFLHNDRIWQLEPLPKVVEFVTHCFQVKALLTSKDALRQGGKTAELIHIDAHFIDQDSTLVFCERGAHKVSLLSSYEVASDISTNAALVVLPCSLSSKAKSTDELVSDSKTVECDGMLKMINAFLTAGAQSVVSCMWGVPDESSIIFMQFFYRYLMDGYDGIQAMSKSINSIRCFHVFSQCLHWSGYRFSGRPVRITFDNCTDSIASLEQRMGPASSFPRLANLNALVSRIGDPNNTIQVSSFVHSVLACIMLW